MRSSLLIETLLYSLTGSNTRLCTSIAPFRPSLQLFIWSPPRGSYSVSAKRVISKTLRHSPLRTSSREGTPIGTSSIPAPSPSVSQIITYNQVSPATARRIESNPRSIRRRNPSRGPSAPASSPFYCAARRTSDNQPRSTTSRRRYLPHCGRAIPSRLHPRFRELK